VVTPSGSFPLRDILEEALPVSSVLFAVLVTTAAGMIPVGLFLCAAVAFDLPELPAKFAKLFPVPRCLDILWAPFLLIHHVNIGIALGMCAALVYLPFAKRSLILFAQVRER
jgi:hypothetical protein